MTIPVNMQTLSNYQIIILVFLWLFTFLITSTYSYRFEPNTLTVNNFSECRENEKYVVHVDYKITQLARNKYVVNGLIIIGENVGRQIEVVWVHCKIYHLKWANRIYFLTTFRFKSFRSVVITIWLNVKALIPSRYATFVGSLIWMANCGLISSHILSRDWGVR